MNINRNTYEEFFLLYVDNELSAADRRAVEAFVQENPDLLPELEMLKEAVIAPEPVSIDKDPLYRHNFPVTESNYEEYFVLYGDDELTREEKEHVEQFVYRHPQHQADFEVILRAKVQPDNSIVYPNKESLYRHEKAERRIVYMQWWKIAVAAVVLLFIGGFGWYFTSHTENAAMPMAEVPVKKAVPSKTVDSHNNKAAEIAENVKPADERPAAVKQVPNTPPVEAAYASSKNARVEKKSFAKRNISTAPVVQQERNKMPVVSTDEMNAPKVELIASNLNEKPLIIDRALSEEEIRTGKIATEYIDASSVNDDNVVYVANTAVNKKNKLRGVFRKASRIFEKATNIDPTEGDRAVRIAGFEIALK